MAPPVAAQSPAARPGAIGGPSQQVERGSVSDIGGVQDVHQDSFIFRGTVADILRLEKLLEEVDTPIGEVLVKAVVYEVRHARADASAVTIAASVLSGKLGVQLGGVVLPNAVTIAVAGIQTVISALSTDNRFKVVSAPSVRVQSGKSARFTVGNETPILGAVTFNPNGQAIQSVEYRPSGVIFDLRPQVRDQVIDLQVFQQMSSFQATTTGVNNSPTLLKRELTTQLAARPGETILIGGLEDSRTSGDESQLPFLPHWLGSRGDQSERTEVLLVLDVRRL